MIMVVRDSKGPVKIENGNSDGISIESRFVMMPNTFYLLTLNEDCLLEYKR